MGIGAADVVARLAVQVSMDTSDAQKNAGKFGRGISKLTGPATAAAAAVAAFATKAGKSASRLQQSMGAVESVFGSSADQIRAWADAADQSVGLAKAEYGELASVIGAQLKNLGVPMDQIAGQTNDLIKLGADLSATYGGTTAEAVEALSSALRGETDPIEKYGISIKQATIEAAVGKDKLKGMTDQQAKAAKTTALLGLVTDQAGGAVGAFAREADTAAGQSQRAAAAWEDASAALGEQLLPYMADAAQAFAGMFGWMQRHTTTVKVLAGVLGVLAAAILTVSAAVKLYNLYTAASAAISAAAWGAALGPILLVIAAVAAVVAVFVILYKKVDWFRAFVDLMWRNFVTGARVAFRAAAVVGAWLFGLLRAYVNTWLRVFRAVFNVLAPIVRVVFRAIAGVVSSTVAVIGRVIGRVADTVRSVMGRVRDIWAAAWGRLAGPAERAMHAAASAVAGVSSALSTVVTWIKRVIDWIGRIRWPKPPAWLNKIVPGAAAASAATTTPAAARAVVVHGPAAAAAPAGGVTIVVQGALDPVAVAAQIRRILSADDRRRGDVISGRPASASGAV